MNELASMYLLVAALAGTPALGDAPLQATPIPGSELKVARFPLGQMCITRNGSCRISPRPINTPCFCGKVTGNVR